MVKVAPSILSADFTVLLEEIKKVESAGADYLHIDVMDGHYVPNITIGYPVVSCLKGRTHLPLDVHLMVENPERFVKSFAKAGASILTVHVEAAVHIHSVLQMIKSLNVVPGIALNPSTPLSSLEYILEDAGVVLLMSVNPGFGGQKYIPQITEKIRALRKMIDERGCNVSIEVDGGVNERNAYEIISAGAEILVAGSAIYNSNCPAEVIQKMKSVNE
ncbi:MAG: ribulose-phosphate 3-epimerase [Thermoanaerobacterales bacterium]|nr:ribulose-phosphate 3-epimerase [Thermoanaerobacterales bacterium]